MVYTTTAFYLASHPVVLGTTKATLIMIFGIFSIWANYDADRQRGHFREVKGEYFI
jgi:hypothetical protein